MNVLDRLKLDVVNCADFAGNRPYEKAAAVGASVLLFNPDEDALVDAHLVDEARGRGFIAGVRFNCVIGEDPVTFANTRSATIELLGGKAKIAIVMMDMELSKSRSATERLAWQAAMIDRWDYIRYARPTLYTVEAFQDQTQNDYVRMLRRNRETGQRLRKIAPQAYIRAAMDPVKPIRAVVDYLAGAISRDELEPVIDPKQGIASYAALDCETRGATIFEAGRIP